MRHFPCQPLLEFSVFLYTAFKFRGRKEIEVYVKSPRKSANVCILPKTNSLESMTPNPLFFFLPLPLLLSKTAWLRDKFPCSQERKKKSETEALLNKQLQGPSGLRSLRVLQGWVVEADVLSPCSSWGLPQNVRGFSSQQERGRSSEASQFAAELR